VGKSLCIRVNLPRAQIINFFRTEPRTGPMRPWVYIYSRTNQLRIFFSMTAGYSEIARSCSDGDRSRLSVAPRDRRVGESPQLPSV